MKVVISGGGTAGHINPAIAIGTYLKENGAEILYIGSDGKLEEKLYSQTGCRFLQFSSKGLDRKHILKNFEILATDFKAYENIKKAVKEFNPDVGVSTGGYISALTMTALRKNKIPFLIHEQNAFPGLTTRLLSRWAEKYAVAFPEANAFLKDPKRSVLTGNPVRQAFFQTNRSAARKKLGLSPDEPVVLCFGGSLGALQLNECFAKIIPFAQKDGITLLIGTGSRYYDEFVKQIKHLAIDPNQIRIQKYIDDMPAVLTACDLAITRAGAMTLSELCAIKKPAILIPSPNVTANHQDKNAQALVNVGGALKISEKDLSDETLYGMIKSLIKSPDTLRNMSESLTPLSIIDGDRRIGKLVEEIYHQK